MIKSNIFFYKLSLNYIYLFLFHFIKLLICALVINLLTLWLNCDISLKILKSLRKMIFARVPVVRDGNFKAKYWQIRIMWLNLKIFSQKFDHLAQVIPLLDASLMTMQSNLIYIYF